MDERDVEKAEADQAEEFEAAGDLDVAVGDEVPEADALEQHESVRPEVAEVSPAGDREANPADVQEQGQAVDYDDEDAWS